MKCKHCGQEHDVREICKGISRRKFFFFGLAAGLFPLVDLKKLKHLGNYQGVDCGLSESQTMIGVWREIMYGGNPGGGKTELLFSVPYHSFPGKLNDTDSWLEINRILEDMSKCKSNQPM